jgi:hypothetical protein
MPMPFQCHWCDKPTMKIEGICIECEQRYEEGNKDIAATIRESESRIRWLEDGLKQIASKKLGLDDEIQAILDGEPTTADEHNTMQEDEKLVYEEDFGETRNAQNFSASPENIVRISDINKEIAEEWNRDREEKIRKESYEKSKEITEEDRKNYKKSMVTSIGYRGED